MRTIARFVILTTLVLVGVATPVGADPTDDAFVAAASYDWGSSRVSLTHIQRQVFRSMGDARAAAVLEKRLMDLAGREDATVAGRSFACRQLALIGSGDCVPTLVALLEHDDLTDMALYALARIPDPSAAHAVTLEWVRRQVRRAAAGDDDVTTAITSRPGADVDDALAVLALQDADLEVRRRATLMLGDRGSVSHRRTLEHLSKRADNATLRATAMLAFARTGDWRNTEDRFAAAAVGEALALAPDAPTRRAALVAAAELGNPSILRVVQPLVADPEVGRDAAAVAVGLALRLAATDRAEARAAIDRVLAARPDDAAVRTAVGDAIAELEATEGFIQEWVVAGPYLQADAKGVMIDHAFDPETDRPVNWTAVPDAARRDPGVVDFNRIWNGGNRCGYAKTVVRIPSTTRARLEIGSDDGVKVWVNGTVVHRNDVARGLTLNQDKVVVPLRAGDNTLLVKVTQGGGDWQFAVRIRDADGFELPAVTITRPE